MAPLLSNRQDPPHEALPRARTADARPVASGQRANTIRHLQAANSQPACSIILSTSTRGKGNPQAKGLLYLNASIVRGLGGQDDAEQRSAFAVGKCRQLAGVTLNDFAADRQSQSHSMPFRREECIKYPCKSFCSIPGP